MGNSVNSLKKLIDECSDTNRHEWTDEARTILEAVRRTSRPTKWKVRRTIAEAILKKIVVPSVANSGWKLGTSQTDIPVGDVLLERDSRQARIEIALLQPATAKFRRTYRDQHSESAYALEMQKKQVQPKPLKGAPRGETRQTTQTRSADERSYRFSDFDILAVNTQAVTRQWPDFRYTLSAWLHPHPGHPSLINIVQLVSLRPSDVWTDDLGLCLDWFSRMGQERSSG
jgi:hypothetical protein